MDQHLLPLPPIFQDMDFGQTAAGEGGGGDHYNDDDDDYYYDQESGFEWPSRFCADPPWVASFPPLIPFFHVNFCPDWPNLSTFF
jgi:hypothetical protein